MVGFRKIMVANRGEIAIRVLRAANEIEKKTVTIYTEEDKLALHRFKADEAYRIGVGQDPIQAYLNVDAIIEVAKRSGADAVHPGYGFLSERPDFAERVISEGLVFIGPSPETMRILGDKVSARKVAMAAGVPVIAASEVLSSDIEEIRKIASSIGYPLMLKASWGGGGRGMRVVRSPDELERQIAAGRSEAALAFGNDDIYLEKLIEKACHVEVQILGDRHGNIVHLFERDCSIQRRNQKVVERAPAPYLSEESRAVICEYALRIARYAKYECAGTVEFLMDKRDGRFYFIEVNPRVQVEHTITEEVTGIDIVKAQIRLAEGAIIGDEVGCGVPIQENISLHGHALQCRVTTEDPLNGFVPDYGRITAYRASTGFGIRLDGGTAYAGAVITPYYDSLLEKVTAWGTSPAESISRIDRALREFRIRGVETNLAFLQNVVNHPKFRIADYTTRFIDEHDELFTFTPRFDRATRLLTYISEIIVNGHPEVAGRHKPVFLKEPSAVQSFNREARPPCDNLVEKLANSGPAAVASWVLNQKRVLITDTTMRDAHQSLLATRVRTTDLLPAAEAYTQFFPEFFSVECWGGATFDVCMRFLQECPWERLSSLRERMPRHLLQMLIRASNAVGYTNYPDNVVRHFVTQAARSGIDVFRIFDSLNWVDNMRVAMDAVIQEGKLCEAAVCYTGDLQDPARSKYDLQYYVNIAKQLRDAGTNILAIKDMAGLLKPDAAAILVRVLKEETGLPIHLHTHDTSGISAATILAAVDAGVDIVDTAVDSFSGLTSQPPMGSIVAMLEHREENTRIDRKALRVLEAYWEQVRVQYSPFESSMRSPTAGVYFHEMPGGQVTNLREQARDLGVADRWSEITDTYAGVNKVFGDVVKVTPSSKVVGDMALAMVTGNISCEDLVSPGVDVSFPESVVQFFRGELGQPSGGFPPDLQQKICKGQALLTERPGSSIPDADLEALRAEAEEKARRKISDEEFASYLMYPKVFLEYALRAVRYGPVTILPTPVFFYGMAHGEEIAIDLEPGKTLIIQYVAIGEDNDSTFVKVFFELNGQPRTIRVENQKISYQKNQRTRADLTNANHVASPMPGQVVSISVKAGQDIQSGDLLLTIAAMKMETSIHAERSGVIKWVVDSGSQVEAKDLLAEYEEQ